LEASFHGYDSSSTLFAAHQQQVKTQLTKPNEKSNRLGAFL